MVELFESYELREVYDDGLKGMYRHSAILEKFIQKYLPKVHKHLEEVDVRVEMFMSDWVISFLCSYIPLNRLNHFLTRFFQRGWVAFHCMVLAILDYLQSEILGTVDMPGAMGVIKTMKEHRNSFNIKRVGKNRRNKEENKDNLIENSSEMPELRFKNKNELSLSFKKEMEAFNQNTDDKRWNEIYKLFEDYNKKIKSKEYKDIFKETKI